MSIIPEVILQKVIVNGYRRLRRDPRLLDALFKNLSQVQLDAVKKFVLDTSVQFNVNFPRNDLQVPALVLVLKNEVESIPFLGDEMTTVLGIDNELAYDTLDGHSGSTSNLSGLPRKILGPLTVTESDADTIEFTEENVLLDLMEDPVGNIVAYVVSGTGEGQIFPILRLRNNSLDIDGTFDPYLDSTSLVDIRVVDNSESALGEPSRVYDATNKRNLRTRGAEYEVTYHLHVMAGGQEEVIYLYSVLKALLISQRPLLESQGIIALKIGGSDFAPRSEYTPSEVFQRMMVLTFTYPFTFVEELDGPSTLEINITADDPITYENSVILEATIEL